MPKGGFRPGSGRPPGSLNKRNAELAERLKERQDLDPLEFLSDVASGRGEPTPSMELRTTAAHQLAPYLYARLQPIPLPVYVAEPFAIGDIETPTAIAAATGRIAFAVAEGKLDFESAQKLASLLEIRLKALSAADLEIRMLALEQSLTGRTHG